MSIRIFGWFGGGLSVMYNIPQIYKNYHSASCNDFSQLSVVMRIIGALCYIAHGALIDDPPLLWMTSIACIQMIFIWGQILYYKNANTTEHEISRLATIQDADK
jgi:uncharacterized protein with PQ loop repeat